MNARIRDYLSTCPDQVFDLVDAFGSPLNLMFPQVIEDNIAAFKDVYARNNVQGRIYVSTKPNKSVAALKQAALCDVGVDVSSENALKFALGCGFDAGRMEATGPKNREYLTLAIQHGITINADNFEELDQIRDIRQTLSKQEKTPVFVRLAGFQSNRLKFTPHDGTFGIHVNETDRLFEYLDQCQEDFDFQGFAFHFNSKVIEQKIVALENILGKTLEAIQKGFSPKGVNIGGGFDISYAQNPENWNHYVNTLKESLRNFSESLTWNNGGLGFRNEGGLIKGAPAFLDHGPNIWGPQELDQLLSLKLPELDNMSMADFLADCLLELYIEPGRAMFDQLGVTVGRVNHVKTSMHGETLVNLDMNRSSMNSAQQKLLTDPVIISRNPKNRASAENGVYYTGNLCLSYDMITYNKTFPDFCPAEGDLVIFINTAPYIMDFVESRTLHQNLAEKVAIAHDGDRYRWFRDEKYQPVHIKSQTRTRGTV